MDPLSSPARPLAFRASLGLGTHISESVRIAVLLARRSRVWAVRGDRGRHMQNAMCDIFTTKHLLARTVDAAPFFARSQHVPGHRQRHLIPCSMHAHLRLLALSLFPLPSLSLPTQFSLLLATSPVAARFSVDFA